MKKAASPRKVTPAVRVHKLDSTNPKLKYIGGSNFDAWNNTIAGQAAGSIWHGLNPDTERVHERQVASLSLLAGISPKDEFEGMLAAQLLASHNAAMECYRRAMIAEQSFEGRKEALTQANKLSRTHATLLEALNRHRGNRIGRLSSFSEYAPTARRFKPESAALESGLTRRVAQNRGAGFASYALVAGAPHRGQRK